MTTPPRTPSWAEIERFLRIDGWEVVRETDHRHFEQALDSGEVLETHTSFDGGGTMSQDRFSWILRVQLKISRRQFWQGLQGGEPVTRPSPEQEPAPPAHEPWILRVLKQDLHLSDEEIASLSVEDAKQRVHDHWSRPKPESG